MTAAEQRETIGIACGWKRVKHPFCEWVSPQGITAPGMILPDYLNDLNAMAEAENTLDGKATEHWHHLFDVHRRYQRSIMAPTVIYMIRASASQRAEAFLRTVGKWTDSATV